jgi:hypothetical protein
MDYAMPRADDLPMFKDDVHAVPATTNPLGVKGAGEAGTTAAIAAVMNAFADAIPGSGTRSRCRRRPRRCGRRAGDGGGLTFSAAGQPGLAVRFRLRVVLGEVRRPASEPRRQWDDGGGVPKSTILGSIA